MERVLDVGLVYSITIGISRLSGVRHQPTHFSSLYGIRLKSIRASFRLKYLKGEAVTL